MDIIDILSTKARTRVTSSRAAEGTSRGRDIETISIWANTNLEGPPNPKLLRETAMISWPRSAIDLRRGQAMAADWEILPIDVDAPTITQNGISSEEFKGFLQKARNKEYVNRIRAIRRVLMRPNVRGKNTSFSGLLGPVINDMLTIGLGAIMPSYNMRGEVAALTYVDAARVRFRVDWDSEDDGWRYVLLDRNMRQGKQLMNNELITMTLNENTFQNIAPSPVLTVYEDLMSLKDTVASVHVLQKNRTPATLVNFDGMSEKDVRRIRNLYETRVEGSQTVAFTNHPMSDVATIKLGSVNIEEQGAQWFTDYIIRSVCSSFHVAPVSLHWTQDLNRATAREQLKITGDDGIEPLMRTVSDYINNEVVATYGDDNLQFVWTELLVKDEAQTADTIRKRFGDKGSWITYNEARRADGLEPMHTNESDPYYVYYNEARYAVGTGEELPIPIVADLPVVQSYDDIQKDQMKQQKVQADAAAARLQASQNNNQQQSDGNNQQQSGNNNQQQSNSKKEPNK